MTNIDTLDQILEKAHQKLLFSWIKNDGKTHTIPTHANYDGCMDETKQALNLYIEEKMKEARLDELKHIDDPANVRLWFDGYYGVKERIEELEG